MSGWWVLDSYGCVLARQPRLRDALAWTVPADHKERTRPCAECASQSLGGGVYEVQTCEGFYTVTRHAPVSVSGGSGDQ